MSLQVWLPLIGDTHNQGLGQYTITILGTLSWVTGKLGATAMRAGNGTQIVNGLQVNTNFTNLLNNDHSISVWVKPYGNHIHYNGSIMSSGNWNTANKRWAFGVSQDNSKVDVLCMNYNTYITCDVPVNEWTNLICVRQGTTVKLYKNGNYIGSRDCSTDPSFDSDANVTCIGRESHANGYFSFNGAIQDLRLYSHALSEMEIKELAKGLVLHYTLNRSGWGQENLLKDSHVAVSTSSYAMHNYYFESGKEPVEGKQYTIQLKGQLGQGKTYFGIYNSGGSVSCVSLTPSSQKNGIYTATFNWRVGSAANTYLRVYHMLSSTTATSTIEWIKLEEGDTATPWCPNSSDSSAETIGLDSTIEYDCSGFGNNGIKNNITYTSDTPKYSVSSVFNGTNSYVKINDNTWMMKGMPAMTINLWAKATTWPTNGGRLLSCTETGGFNLEAGNSGYWRFPVYVYTNEAQTSSAYKYDSKEIKISDLTPNDWNMITLVYETTGTKTYLNGQLHHTYTNTSYGINFNTSARLFLGCEANGANPYTPYFNGMESDFRIYATALSADDIQSLYEDRGYIDNKGNVYGTLYEI